MADSIEEIDLLKTDWNNLTPEDFNKLSEKLNSRNKLIKQQKKLQKRTRLTKEELEKEVTCTIRGKAYSIPTKLFTRLQNMKNNLSKEKLINEIINNYSIIEEL